MAEGVQEGHGTRLEKRLGKRYAFLSILGQGAAGTVYEVMNLHLNRKEALKVLADTQPKDFSNRFSHEAKVSAAMDHPNIVKIFEFEQVKGSFWYSMQFINGPSLAQVMAARKDLDDTAMARLAIPLLDALQYSHVQGVIHRDIKPGNILINEWGRPFLTDFGIAKTMDNLIKTRTGTMLGTPAYVAPEQAMGHPVDHRADIYALGVTLYELLAKRLPFTAENSLQTVVMRLQEDPEPLLSHCPEVHPAFAEIIMRALAREKEGRWESAAQMKDALIHACATLGISWDQPWIAPGVCGAARQGRDAADDHRPRRRRPLANRLRAPSQPPLVPHPWPLDGGPPAAGHPGDLLANPSPCADATTPPGPNPGPGPTDPSRIDCHASAPGHLRAAACHAHLPSPGSTSAGASAPQSRQPPHARGVLPAGAEGRPALRRHHGEPVPPGGPGRQGEGEPGPLEGAARMRQSRPGGRFALPLQARPGRPGRADAHGAHGPRLPHGPSRARGHRA